MTIATVLRVVCLITLVVAVGRASAQPASEADRLFEQGRTLAKEGKYAEACDRFEKSFALDATVGTELNLADCHEHLGNLRKAWELFSAAADASLKASDTARAKFARERADVVARRLATVVIVPPTPVPPALTIQVAGRTLIGAKLEDRVTPGQIEVVVTVPDRPPFKTRVTALPGAKVEVQVPPFGQSKTTDKKPISKRRQRILLTWGLGALAGTGLITSTALTIKARNDYNSTADGSHCERVPGGIRCDDIGDRQIAHAQHTADIATGFAIGGVLLAGAAAAVYFTAPRDVTVTPTASAGGAGILVRGAF